jgi:hypothetical protein
LLQPSHETRFSRITVEACWAPQPIATARKQRVIWISPINGGQLKIMNNGAIKAKRLIP